MPIPRMTTRRWMIAVAVAGLSFGSLMQRRAMLLSRADQHLRAAGLIAIRSPTGETRLYPDSARELVRPGWHVKLRDKYRKAARYPWLPVPPDPLPPE